MTSEAPPFWWQESDWRAWMLYPLSACYGLVAGKRMEMARPPRAPIPVLCVGNLTVGGAGKTPVAIALARQARRQGLKPGFLTRGYGGGLTRPHLADPRHHTAWHSGDEPLLLARHGPVAVAADRIAGLGLLLGQGCDFAIMDDGFQSVRLHFDFALIVIDAQRGIGNGHVVPGGPLRAPVSAQLRLADAVLRIGDGNGAVQVVRGAARAGKPVYGAETRIVGRKRYAGRRFLAFAGIGHPEKFFAALRDAGAETVLTREFGDHHPYSDDDIRSLAAEAEKAGLELATTAKDAVRFENGTPTAREFLERLAVVEIETVFSPARIAGKIIDETVANFRRRTIG